MDMKNRVADIAKLAGVSPGTVSNALNGRKGVSQVKKEQILQIAQQLGYEHTTNKKTEGSLRFVMFKRHGFVVDDTPFFTQLISGIETQSKFFGYDVMISRLTSKELKDKSIVDTLDSDNSDGVIFLATEMYAGDLVALENVKKPIIILDNFFRQQDFDSVSIANEDGVFVATKHLIENGHRHIGFLDSSAHINNFFYRRRSFSTTMYDYGLNVDDKDKIALAPTMEGAYADMKSWIEANGVKNFPTALIAQNDIIAFGAMRAIKEVGLRIPEDVSIVGFDDMPFCEISSPRLTTVCVKKETMGARAVSMLIRRIEEPSRDAVKTEICCKLVERDSVKTIKSTKLTPKFAVGVV